MTISKYILLVPLLLFTIKSKGQNIILNHSFEDFKNGNASVSPWEFINSTDFYHYTNLKGNEQVVKPEDGKAYVGIRVNKKYREFLFSKLSTSIMSGHKYAFSFYIYNKEDADCYLKSIGLAFSDKKPTEDQINNLKINPALEFRSEEALQTKNSWVKLAGEFTAVSDEKYIVIGNFSKSKNERIKNKSLKIDIYEANEAYYYIDNLVLTDLEVIEAMPIIAFEEQTKPDTVAKVEQLIFSTIYFDTNSEVLTEESIKELERLKLIIESGPCKVKLQGYADSTGSKEKNIALAKHRALEVSDYFNSNGISANKIAIDQNIESSTAGNMDDLKKNRKVSISITRK